MTRFSRLLPPIGDEPAREVDIREIKQSDLMKCPHCILVADHYREDGSCRCNDPDHKVMKQWGYKWKGERWQ